MCKQRWLWGRRGTMIIGALITMVFFFAYTQVRTNGENTGFTCAISFCLVSLPFLLSYPLLSQLLRAFCFRSRINDISKIVSSASTLHNHQSSRPSRSPNGSDDDTPMPKPDARHFQFWDLESTMTFALSGWRASANVAGFCINIQAMCRVSRTITRL